MKNLIEKEKFKISFEFYLELSNAETNKLIESYIENQVTISLVQSKVITNEQLLFNYLSLHNMREDQIIGIIHLYYSEIELMINRIFYQIVMKSVSYLNECSLESDFKSLCETEEFM